MTAHTNPRRALVVDDEPGIRFVLVRALAGVGLEAAEAGSLTEARHRLSQESFGGVFVDIRLPDGSGLDLARELSRLEPRPLVVVMTAQDTVEVHYAGWTTDGKMFDNSYERGETIKFPLGGVIKGWTEGLQLMVEGEKRRLWLPEDLAYKGVNGAPQGTLVFDVELVKIIKN